MDKKKIGILTHFKADNYGANIQALSTASYLNNHGCQPIFINWDSYLSNMNQRTNPQQINIHDSFIANSFKVTRPCSDDKSIRNIIYEEQIDGIIVGSDAVLTVIPEILYFKIKRTGITKSIPSKNHIFPNPFWLSFLNENETIKSVLLSPSTQNSVYWLLSKSLRKEMKNALNKFNYITARDSFTGKMIQYLNPDIGNIRITPDPVFGFNYNIVQDISKNDILRKFNLPENYLLVSFYKDFTPKESWLIKFRDVALNKGLVCVNLPMPQGSRINCFDYSIELPLDPLDWYNLIRFSKGYVGNNMHPIIVSLHNNNPFFSIDQHGLKITRFYKNYKMSKTYELLNSADLKEFWMPINNLDIDSIEHILNKLKNFNINKCKEFSVRALKRYKKMMNEIEYTFE